MYKPHAKGDARVYKPHTKGPTPACTNPTRRGTPVCTAPHRGTDAHVYKPHVEGGIPESDLKAGPPESITETLPEAHVGGDRCSSVQVPDGVTSFPIA